MRIFNSGQDSNCNRSIVTMGAFDGIHKGHKAILERVITEGKRLNLSPTLFTLWPHPKKILKQSSPLELLNSLDEKKEFLSAMGIEQLYIQEFSPNFSQLPAEDFIKDILVGRLQAKKVIIGYDHKFGQGRKGNIQVLRQAGSELGFEVEEITEQQIQKNTISSTQVRDYISNGNILQANEMLGYSYPISGKVIHGDQIGRSIGFPTANLQVLEPDKLLPKHGAYIVSVLIGNQSFRGMLNLGYRPTVDGQSLRIEVHIFDFNKDLYGQNIKVELLDHLRDETKFESIDQLKAQLYTDKEEALNYST